MPMYGRKFEERQARSILWRRASSSSGCASGCWLPVLECRAFKSWLRGFSSALRPLLDVRPFRCLLDCLSRARPSGTLHGFPYCRVFYEGGSGPPLGQRSSIFSPVPTSWVYLHSVCLSVCLSDPPLTRTPRSCASGGSPLVCLHHDPNQNSKAFLRRWLVYWQWQVHPLTAHTLVWQLPILVTLQQTFSLSVSYRPEQHIWPWWSEVVASPHTLHLSLASSSAVPVSGFVIRKSYLTLSLGSDFKVTLWPIVAVSNEWLWPRSVVYGFYIY